MPIAVAGSAIFANARRIAGVMSAAIVVGCSSPKDAAPRAESSASRAAAGAAPGAPTCPATGLWAECSVLYRLERAGIAPHLDSTGKAEEKLLGGRSFVVKFGTASRLEVFLYPDSVARAADAAKLDRTKLVNATAPQTINRERTLIENGNLIGLLSSLNERLRERVSDALSAGAPQPASPSSSQPLSKPATRLPAQPARSSVPK